MHLPTKQIRPAPADAGYTAALDGAALPGAFLSAADAGRELDLAAYYRLLPAQGLDPLWAPDAATIDLALRVFPALFRHPALRASADKAFAAYLGAADGWDRWAIRPDGSLEVQPTARRRARAAGPSRPAEPYHITYTAPSAAYAAETPWQIRHTCTCPDVVFREAAHGGVCKHVALALLLRLAQAGAAALGRLSDQLRAAADQAGLPAAPPPIPAAPPDDGPAADLAFIELPARQLSAALAAARAACDPPGLVTLRLAEGACAIWAGDSPAPTLQLAGHDGGGTVTRTLAPRQLDLICAYLQHTAAASPDLPVQLLLTPDDLSLCPLAASTPPLSLNAAAG